MRSLEELGALERFGLCAGVAIAGVTLAAKVGGLAYQHSLEERIADVREAVFAPSSMVPYYEFVLSQAETLGLEMSAAGGLVKQALCDPATVFDVEARTIRVSDDPLSRTRARATICRPGENTVRDMDFRLKRLKDESGIWVPATPEHSQEIARRSRLLQDDVNRRAKKSKLPTGPELSVFAYEPDWPEGRSFRLTDYASRTELIDAETERLFDNNGNEVLIPVDEPWTCIVTMYREDGSTYELWIPTDSPQTLLGRTLTRSSVIRKRELQDVAVAIRNLRAIGVLTPETTSNWQDYLDFRQQMDGSIDLAAIRERAASGQRGHAAHLLGLRALAPLTGPVERSWLSAAIRDPQSPVGKLIASRMMHTVN